MLTKRLVLGLVVAAALPPTVGWVNGAGAGPARPGLALADAGSQQPPPACASGTCTVTYPVAGGGQPFTVPLGVTMLKASLLGASGGSYDKTSGGAGASVNATVRVTPGEALTVAVGLAGAFASDSQTPLGSFTTADNSAGWFQSNGGHGAGGGGASDVEAGGTQLLVAGGGGGAGGSTGSTSGCFIVDFAGGVGGDSGQTGAAGGAGGNEDNDAVDFDGGAGGGGGGASSAGQGGSGGAFYIQRLSSDNQTTECVQGVYAGSAGRSGNGRIGGSGESQGNGARAAGGAGGSGYHAGGAGGSGSGNNVYDFAAAGGGGGGSSYVDASATTSTVVTGPNHSCDSSDCGSQYSQTGKGNGYVVLTYTIPAGITAPKAPTDVHAVAGNTTATVTFTPGYDGGEPVSGYYVNAYDETNGQRTDEPSSSSSPATVSGLTNGHSYHFTVLAGSAAGLGAESGPSNTVVPAQPPGPPTNVVATPGTGSASVSFTPPSFDGFSPITGYTVTATNTAGTGQAPITATGSSSPITVPGLHGGDAYTFTVTATNRIGSTTSTPSAAVTVRGTPTLSGPPTNVQASPAGIVTGDSFTYDRAHVSFSPPADSGTYPLRSYDVVTHDQTTPGAVVPTTRGTSSPITVTGLTQDHVYTFTVVPNTSDGANTYAGTESAPSAPIIEGSNTPGPPVLASATGYSPAGGVSPGVIRLVWNDPVLNVNINSYNVYAGTSPGGEQASPIATGVLPTFVNGLSQTDIPTTYDLKNLTAGVTYYFTVRAVANGGVSAPSNELSATDVDRPTPPTQADRGVGDSSITLYWAPPVSDGGSPVTGYNIYQGTTSGGEASAPINSTLLPASTTTYEIDGLTPGITYYFLIKAGNRVGLSAPSPELAGTPRARPGTPTNVTATPADGQVSLTWSPPASNGGAIQGYDVYVGTAPGNETGNAVNPSGSLGPNARTYTVTGLTNGTTYYFYVQAFDNREGSALTNEVSATPMGSPTAPTAPPALPELPLPTLLPLAGLGLGLLALRRRSRRR